MELSAEGFWGLFGLELDAGKNFGIYPFLHEHIISVSSVQVLLTLSWDFCMICRMLCGLFKLWQIMQQAYKKLCISSLTWTNLLTGRISATYLI